MGSESSSRTQLAEWRALAEHAQTVGAAHLRDLFAQDPGRGERLALEFAGIYFDYSKHRVTDETLRLLRPGFRHCFALIRDPGGWTLLDPLSGRLVVTRLPAAPTADIPRRYRAAGASGWFSGRAASKAGRVRHEASIRASVG